MNATSSEGAPVGSPEHAFRERIEKTLDSLDGLAQKLSDVDRIREVIAEVVVENRQLKRDNRRLSKALVAQGSDEDDGDMARLLLAAQEKVRVAQQQVADLIEESTDLQSRILELEELNGSMMSMYVSSYQLHATLDLDEVVRVIEEIVINFIGAKEYAVLLAEENGTFRVTASKGLGARLPATGIEARGVLAEVVGSRTAYVHTSMRPAREGVLAAVPLSMGTQTVGAVIIYSLLSQKDQLLRNDVELLSLLGGHAASALVSSRLYARADRKLKTLEGIISLLDEGPS